MRLLLVGIRWLARWWWDVVRLVRLPNRRALAEPSPDYSSSLVAQTAHRLGLSAEEEGPGHFVLTGSLEETRARVEITARRATDGRVRFRQHVELVAQAPLTSGRVDVAPREGRAPGRSVGEPVFDRLARLRSTDPATGFAAMVPEVRAGVIKLGGVWRIEGPVLTWSAERAPTYLCAASELLLTALEALAAHRGDPVPALEALVERDPVPEVRRRALRLLHERDSDRASPARLKALEDPIPTVRAEAMVQLPEPTPPEALPALRALALDRIPEGLRRRAVERLGPEASTLRAPARRCLDARRSEEDQIRGLRILALVGVGEDLGHLEAWSTRSGPVRKVLDQTKVALRSRLGLTAGTLALVEAGGELSDADPAG